MNKEDKEMKWESGSETYSLHHMDDGTQQGSSKIWEQSGTVLTAGEHVEASDADHMVNLVYNDIVDGKYFEIRDKVFICFCFLDRRKISGGGAFVQGVRPFSGGLKHIDTFIRPNDSKSENLLV